jgi:uncharacterized repeat protein (TIGR04076 family)
MGNQTVNTGSPTGRRGRAAADAPPRGEVPVVRVSVERVGGACPAGHRVGDRYELSWRTPSGLCAEAFCALFPLVGRLRAPGGAESPDRDRLEAVCPGAGGVAFRVERRGDVVARVEPVATVAEPTIGGRGRPVPASSQR